MLKRIMNSGIIEMIMSVLVIEFVYCGGLEKLLWYVTHTVKVYNCHYQVEGILAIWAALIVFAVGLREFMKNELGFEI